MTHQRVREPGAREHLVISRKKSSPYRYDGAHDTLAMALCATLLATAPRASLTDGARIDGTARAHSSLFATRAQCTIWAFDVAVREVYLLLSQWPPRPSFRGARLAPVAQGMLGIAR